MSSKKRREEEMRAKAAAEAARKKQLRIFFVLALLATFLFAFLLFSNPSVIYVICLVVCIACAFRVFMDMTSE